MPVAALRAELKWKGERRDCKSHCKKVGHGREVIRILFRGKKMLCFARKRRIKEVDKKYIYKI